MKTVAEMREVAKDRVEDLGAGGKKAAMALVGAPVVARRRIAGYAGKGWKSLQKEFEAWVTEGERLSGEIRQGKVVTGVKERVDFDQLQGRVEKLKDQLEDVLTNWRETFKPGEDAVVEDEPKTAKKPAASSTTAKKTTTAKKAQPAPEKVDDAD